MKWKLLIFTETELSCFSLCPVFLFLPRNFEHSYLKNTVELLLHCVRKGNKFCFWGLYVSFFPFFLYFVPSFSGFQKCQSLIRCQCIGRDGSHLHRLPHQWCCVVALRWCSSHLYVCFLFL